MNIGVTRPQWVNIIHSIYYNGSAAEINDLDIALIRFRYNNEFKHCDPLTLKYAPHQKELELTSKYRF